MLTVLHLPTYVPKQAQIGQFIMYPIKDVLVLTLRGQIGVLMNTFPTVVLLQALVSAAQTTTALAAVQPAVKSQCIETSGPTIMDKPVAEVH
jgi:hypothetical protein